MAGLSFYKKRRRINYDLIRELIVWILEIVVVCLIAFVCVWYFGQRISVIGDSMNPELQSGDVTLVNKIVYDMSTPKRGDIVAFKPNGKESSHYYIKRIVALPGETVEFVEGSVYVDGELLEEEYITTEIMDVGIVDEPITLGSDEFFVLGDDRENSDDSRTAEIGNVKRSEIEGKIWFTISPKDSFGFVK